MPTPTSTSTAASAPPARAPATGSHTQWSAFFSKHSFAAATAAAATRPAAPSSHDRHPLSFSPSPAGAPSTISRSVDEPPLRQRGSKLARTRSVSSQGTATQSPSPSVSSADPDSGSSSIIKSEAGHLEAMRKLRRLVLAHGVPDDSSKLLPNSLPPRSLIWKLLLSIRSLPLSPYLHLLSLGPSRAHSKIRNDTFRTLATDRGFKQRVSEHMLVRLLDAFVWKHDGAEQQQLAPLDSPGDAHCYDFSYVQGMNVLAAPFLYTMPSELEAFACFSAFIERCAPTYVQPTLEGVHRGLLLLDRCLEMADPELFAHLRERKLSAELYAFPSVLTLCACTPPLDQVLELWDFLLSFGVHLNVLCVLSQLLLMRSELMDSPSPMRLLRTLPPLNASRIIGITVTLVRDLPDELYADLIEHTGARVSSVNPAMTTTMTMRGATVADQLRPTPPPPPHQQASARR